MASPKSTLPNSREEQDRAYNPGELRYSEENLTASQPQDEPNQSSSPDGRDIQAAEEAGSATEKPDYINRVTGNKRGRESRWSKVFIFAQRRGGVLGLLGALGLGGGLMVGFFGPSSMLISLMENLSLTNDSSSTVMERRFMKAFSFANIGDPVCANNSRATLKCRMGKISNSALYKLNRQGMTAYFEGGTPYDGKRTGYPARNPVGYTIDLKDGSAPRNVAVADLPGFLADNPKAAAKVLGRAGAFNLRFKAWAGKHITNKLFRPFNLKRDGGLASGRNVQASGPTKRDSIFEKLRERLPGSNALGNVAGNINTKVTSHLGKAKAGGAIYMTAVVGCIGVKAPAYIASGVAAVQLAQLLPMSMDTVLSPGAMAKATGFGSGFTPEDMDAVGTILTERTPRESDGKMTSALDSPYLLAAMGVNKNSPPVSEKYTPGYSILTNPAIQVANDVDKALEPACGAILSPAAMYTALAVNSVATVALSATIIGGVAKVLADFLIVEIATGVASAVIGDLAKTALVEVAKSDAIPNAEGEALGEVIGISASAFFSAGGMAHHLPTLSESQLPEFETVRAENEEFRRQMDIATLSPFDTSSRYTFLGSILNNMRLAVIGSGGYGNISTMFSGLSQLPVAALSPNASAAHFSTRNCTYADEFGLSTGDPLTTPAINMAGLPCSGITPQQAAMSTEEAIDLLLYEGWIDESKPVYDGDLIEDLVDREVIKPDTPLWNFIDSCSNPDTGDYLFNAPGCVVNSTPQDLNSGRCVDIKNETAEQVEVCADSSSDTLGGGT